MSTLQDPSGAGEANVVDAVSPDFTGKKALVTVSAPGIGAATATLQTAGNATLVAIENRIPVQGQAAMAASQPVVIASNQSTVPVSTASLPLPTGAATSALQTQPGVDIGDVTVNNAAGAAAVNVQDGGNSLTVDGTFWQATQPVSAAALPLPTGAATSALQTTGNTSLSSIDTKTPALGQAVMASSQPVVIASNQTVPVNLVSSANSTGMFAREFFDAFGRLRISQPATLFDSKQIGDKQPLIWDDQLISGSGGASTYNTNQASTTLTTGAFTAGVRMRQTFRRFNYQPGKGQLIMQTGVLGSPAAGTTRRIGLMDNFNGVFFESNPTDVRVVVRSNTSGTPSDTNYATQANWNIDKLNGNGPSGITVDWSKSQIFGSSFEWLGVGSAWVFVVINGAFINVHRFDCANISVFVYMSMPNLPLRYEIRNDGSGAAQAITHVCSTVISEGGKIDTGTGRGITRELTPLVTLNDTQLYPLFAIRVNSTHTFADIKLLNLSILCTSNATYNWFLFANPTISGTALVYTTPAFSAVEVANAGLSTTTITGGTTLSAGTEAQVTGDSIRIQLPLAETDYQLGVALDGTRDVIVLAVQRVVGTTETFYGAMNWRENE